VDYNTLIHVSCFVLVSASVMKLTCKNSCIHLRHCSCKIKGIIYVCICLAGDDGDTCIDIIMSKGENTWLNGYDVMLQSG
jgi:hypothetical protein